MLFWDQATFAKNRFYEFQEPSEAVDATPTCSKQKCLACSPLKLLENVPRPEERVPWAPPKNHPERARSRSVKPIKNPQKVCSILLFQIRASEKKS